jgi:hypothetical protein
MKRRGRDGDRASRTAGAWKRRLGALTALAVISVSGAAFGDYPNSPEQGSAVSAYAGNAPPEFEPGGLDIRGGPDRNQITIALHRPAGLFLVADRSGIVPGGALKPEQSSCESVDPFLVRCAHLGPDVFAVSGGDDDEVEIKATVRGTGFVRTGDGSDRIAVAKRGNSRAEFFGGRGADALIGGPSGRSARPQGRRSDQLQGAAGGDVVRGAAGADRITGGAGRDRLYGGSGFDRIGAADGERDRILDCGPGRDIAVVDVIDPRSRRCERTREASDFGR